MKTYCGHCGHEIFQRNDGTWDLVYVEYVPSYWCYRGDPRMTPTAHEPGA